MRSTELMLRKLWKSLLKAEIDSCFFFFFSDWFAVSGSYLLLNNFSLDYETTPEINVTIEATDNGSPPYSKEVCFKSFNPFLTVFRLSPKYTAHSSSDWGSIKDRDWLPNRLLLV